jgi:hypothetical protein
MTPEEEQLKRSKLIDEALVDIKEYEEDHDN